MNSKLIISALIALSASMMTAQAQDQWAVTTTSSNNLRKAPDYESSLETQTLMGSVLECTGSADRYWTEVNALAPEYDGCWVNDMTISRMTESDVIKYVGAEKFIVTAEYSHVYESSSPTSDVICDLVMGDLVRKTYTDKGSVFRTLGCAKILLPDGREGYVKLNDVLDFKVWAEGRDLTAKNLEALARKFVGTPYLWGGNTIKGMDCSGLVWLTYYMNGVLLPRNASEMVKCGVDVATWTLTPGDLIFFGDKETGEIQHVGLFIGDNHIIHSSQMVRINSINPLDEDYYSRDIICARHIIGHIDDGTGAKSLLKSPLFFKQ